MKAGIVIRSAVVLAALSGLLATGCGDEESVRFSDAKIIDKLHLEESGNGYAIDGDPFCEIEGKLLNDAEEVSNAADRDEVGVVLASNQGNVGVKLVPPFAPDCRDRAKKKLNKLDPKPKDEDS
jgi:hypothetical protein